MGLWNYCEVCGKRIETGEPCIGVKECSEHLCGDSICLDCAKIENLPEGERPISITDLLSRAEKAEARAEKAEKCIKAIEDTLGDDFSLDRLRELVEADRDGRCHIGRCVECAHYEGLAVCEYLGDCGGTNWICGWFEPKKSDEAALKGEQDEKMQRPKT